MAITYGASIGTPVLDPDIQTTTIAITGVTVPSGARVVVNVSWYNPGITASMSGGSLTWTQEKALAGTASSNRNVAQFSAHAASGLSSQTLTCTFSGAAYGRSIQGFYATGIDTSAAATAGSNGAAFAGDSLGGLPWDTGSVVTTGEALIASFVWYEGIGTANTPGGSDIEITDTTGGGSQTWAQQYRIEAAAGSHNGTGTLTTDGGNECVAIMAAYKVAGAVTTSLPIPRRLTGRPAPGLTAR